MTRIKDLEEVIWRRGIEGHEDNEIGVDFARLKEQDCPEKKLHEQCEGSVDKKDILLECYHDATDQPKQDKTISSENYEMPRGRRGAP